MTARTPKPLRTTGRLLRALFGLLALAALVAGVPYLLLAIGHPPTELAGGINLFAPDDGSLLYVVATLIGWIAWAAFVFSVGMEIVALVRRRSVPRIKGLGGLQSLASALVGGIILLAPTAASAATTSQATAAVSIHTPAAVSPSSAADAGQRTTSQGSAWPTHTVTGPTETPWGLAQEYLGDGQRWKDIAALNPDVPELAAGDQYLPQGAVLNLPTDARTEQPAAASATVSTSAPAPDTAASHSHPEQQVDDAPTSSQQHEQVTVHGGDSLWSIAADQGDPAQWRAIYELNKGEAQPGGHHFTNPALIYPGQKLDLPAPPEAKPAAPADDDPAPAHTRSKPHSAVSPKTPSPQHPHAEDGPSDQAKPPAPVQQAPSHNPRPTTSPSPESHGETAPQPAAAPGQEADEEVLAPIGIWAGGTLAAAVIATLATRRILQQRRRRPGRRIPMPEGRAAATERSLRAAQHPTGFDLLDATLRTLVLNLSAAGRDLPALAAVVLHETRVDLHLTHEAPPMAPFVPSAGRQDLWTCSAHSEALATDDELAHADTPYPALVSIGWDAHDHLVLIDLEEVGLLHLVGDADLARHVLQAVAVELATAPLPGHLEVTAIGSAAPGLEDVAAERVARRSSTDATAGLADHLADQRRALEAVGATGLKDARLRDEAAGAWTPHILLLQDPPEDQDLTDLLDQLAKEPRSAGAVITSSTSSPAPGTGWTLECRGPSETVVLPGSQLPVRLQALTDDNYNDAVHLLQLAASDTDVPAPQWPGDDVVELKPATDGPDTGDVEPGDQSDEEEDLYAELALDTIDDAPPATAPASSPVAVQPPVSLDKQSPGPSLADVLEDAETALPEQPVVTAPVIPQPATAQDTSPAPHTPADAAALPEAPGILVLGPVTIEGATGRIDSNRINAGTELVAYLALNPGADHHAVDDALWPGRLVNKSMRNAVISRTRSWLGKDTDGTPHLPRVQDTGDYRYRLGPSVTCDWIHFQPLARTGLTRHDDAGTLALREALTLVRGRPFSGVDPQRYAWAEPVVQEMVSAIVDVAYELSTRAREKGDHTGALWAARRGLLAAEESELLHRQVFLAHHAAGDTDALREAAARLTHINEQLGGGTGSLDMEAETATLLRSLLSNRIPKAAPTTN